MEAVNCESYCVIESLLETPFSTRSLEEKRRLSAQVVPRPKMTNLKSFYSKGGRTITRNFCVDNYEAQKWLCGSEKLNKLFCWPCLLFHGSKDKGVWSKTGFVDLNHLSTALRAHASSRDHIDNSMALKTFGRVRIDEALDHGREVARKNHNLLVDKNRKNMRTLIDIVCYLGSHGLSFRGHDEREESVNRGNYKDFCSFMASKDPTFEEFLNGNVFTGTSGMIQNELIGCVGEMMIREIQQEVAEANFVAILLDETTDSARLSQLASALRYVKRNGQPVERLVGLNDVSSDKTAAALAHHVDILTDKYNITAEKLVAQTYDGAAVMSGSTGGTQALVKQKFPRADFIHCRAHVLNLVLLRACVNDRQTGSFFKSLSSIASFFSQSPKRSHELKKFIEAKIPNVCRTKWAYTSRMVNTVQENYEGILTCLGEIFLGDSEFDSDTCALARGLHSAMLEFNFIFQLEIFAAIFSYTDILYGVLQKKELDMIECNKYVQLCRDNIEKLKTEKRKSEIINKAMTVAGGSKSKSKNCEALYDTIIDSILKELDSRFKSLGAFRYVGLLNASKFELYNSNFPTDLMQSLKVHFEDTFDITKLTNELKVLYSKEEFASKKVYEILNIVLDDEMEDVFSETYKLAKLILTLPNTTASVERTFSVLRRIKNYLRTTMGEERLFHLMLMAVEADLLKSLMKKGTFYDDVIDMFANRVQRRIPLLYK